MKKKIMLLLTIMLLVVTGCETKNNYFKGTISEITDIYFVVIPDEDEPIKKIGDIVLVPKEVISTDGVPDIIVGERVQIVYKDAKKSDDGAKIDVVFAIYKESDLN